MTTPSTPGTFQAFAHVWTPDYQYWARVGAEAYTEAEARANIEAVADRHWPRGKDVARRAAFLSRCHVTGPGLPPLPDARRAR